MYIFKINHGGKQKPHGREQKMVTVLKTNLFDCKWSRWCDIRSQQEAELYERCEAAWRTENKSNHRITVWMWKFMQVTPHWWFLNWLSNQKPKKKKDNKINKNTTKRLLSDDSIRTSLQRDRLCSSSSAASPHTDPPQAAEGNCGREEQHVEDYTDDESSLLLVRSRCRLQREKWFHY